MVLHVDLDSFFIAVERRRRPELAGRPVIVGGRRGSRGVVAAASREARRYGIRVGMSLAQASLRCPDGEFLDGALDECFAAVGQVDEILRAESADVEWISIDEAFVGFPAAVSFARALAAAAHLHRAIERLGFAASCGVARSKVVAKVASSLGRPNGIVDVREGYEARFLSPLKIELLPDLDAALARRLRAAGIRRLGQITRLGESELARLAGHAAPSLARTAAGIDTRRVSRTPMPPARLRERDLPAPSSDPAELHAAIRAEADRAGRDLRSRGVFARSVTLRVRFADGRVDSRTLSLKEPAALDEALASAGIDLLSRVWTGERLIRGVAISCSGLLPGAGELFPLRRA